MQFRKKNIKVNFFTFDDELLHILKEQFEIGMINYLRPIVLDGEYASLLEVRSETSKKMIINTETGEYFLKQIPWYCNTDEEIKFSHNVQTRLKEQGIPLAEILRTKQGDTWINIRDEKFVLFRYIDGVRYKYNNKQLKNAAVTLAKINTITFENKFSTDYFNLIEEHLLALKEKNAELYTYLENHVDKIKQVLYENNYFTMKTSCLHGDYNIWNVIFDRYTDKVKGVLDFDNVDTGPRIRDIAEAVLSFGVMEYIKDTTNFSENIYNRNKYKDARMFLYEYKTVSPLTFDEEKCLPYMIKLIFIELVSLAIIRGDYIYKKATHEKIFSFLEKEYLEII